MKIRSLFAAALAVLVLAACGPKKTAAQLELEQTAPAFTAGAHKRLVAMDLDATLTQHKTPLSDTARAALDKLGEKYHLLMVGGGGVERIHRQMLDYPIDILGNYGLEEARVIDGVWTITRHEKVAVDSAEIMRKTEFFREKYGYTHYYGDPVEFHESGMVTFGLLGTKAPKEEKLNFDPDKLKRRAIYKEVCDSFSNHSVFIGGSTSTRRMRSSSSATTWRKAATTATSVWAAWTTSTSTTTATSRSLSSLCFLVLDLGPDFGAGFLEDLLGLLVTVRRSLPHKGEDDCAHESEDQGHEEHRIPSVVLRKGTEEQARDGRAQVAQDAYDSVCGSGHPLGRLVGRGDAQEGLRHIDEEACQDDEDDAQCGGRSRSLPEEEEAYRGADEADEAGPVGLALEELVGRPACQQGADDAAHDLRSGHGGGSRLDGQALELREEGGSPVEDREPDDIDEEIGEREDPEDGVLEDHLADHLLIHAVLEGGVFLMRLSLPVLFLVLVQALRVGKSYVGRIVL